MNPIESNTVTNLLKYHTFIPYEDSINTIRLKNLIRTIYLSNDPLSNNYSFENFDIDNQLAITFGYLENEIVLLSTLYKRENYVNGLARTMNRVWKHPKIRAPGFGKFIKDEDITSLEIVPFHIEIAKQNNINTLFISIEGGAYRYLNFLSKKLSNKTSLEWIALKNKIDVTGKNNLQHITYCHINPCTFSKTGKNKKILIVS